MQNFTEVHQIILMYVNLPRGVGLEPPMSAFLLLIAMQTHVFTENFISVPYDNMDAVRHPGRDSKPERKWTDQYRQISHSSTRLVIVCVKVASGLSFNLIISAVAVFFKKSKKATGMQGFYEVTRVGIAIDVASASLLDADSRA